MNSMDSSWGGLKLLKIDNGREVIEPVKKGRNKRVQKKLNKSHGYKTVNGTDDYVMIGGRSLIGYTITITKLSKGRK